MREGFHFHVATPPGEGGIAVIELYGEGAAAALAGRFRPAHGRLPADGEIRLGRLEGASGEPLDEVLLARVPPAASWCRLGSWALTCHGGRLMQRRVREALAAAGGRELDRRGVVDLARAQGRLDRLQADAMALLPAARTGRAARFLLRAAAGELSDRLRQACAAGAGLKAVLEAALAAAPAALALVEPRRILLAGRPNAGKSSLFNRLVERERAAVTSVPGTTRDLVEEPGEIDGFPVVFVDSAGLRPDSEAADGVEREGLRRVRCAPADGIIFLIDQARGLDPDEEAFLAGRDPRTVLIVRAKADLQPLETRPVAVRGTGGRVPREAVWVSAWTGEGLDSLRDRIREAWLGPSGESSPPLGSFTPIGPFTAGQEEALARALSLPSVDAVGKAILEWLDS